MKMFALVPILVIFGMLSLSVSIWLSRCSICCRRRRTSNRSENNGGGDSTNGRTSEEGDTGGGDSENNEGAGNGSKNNKYANKIVNYCLCAKRRWRMQKKKKQLEYLPPFLVDICQVDKVPFGSTTSLPSLPPSEILIQQQSIAALNVKDAGGGGICSGTGRKRRRNSMTVALKDYFENDCEKCGCFSSKGGKVCCDENLQGDSCRGRDNLAFESDIVTVNNCSKKLTTPIATYSSSSPSSLSCSSPCNQDDVNSKVHAANESR